jgi:transcriptional regulator with XRE-family HTH domain
MDGKLNEKPENQPAVPVLKDESVASELVRARKVLGLTQNELHLRTGISRDTIKQYETGRHLPGAREIRLLSAALGVSPNRLLLGSDEFQLAPSPLQSLMNDAEADDAKKMFRFMILYNMLTVAERNAVLTLVEPILVGRKGGDKEIRKAFAAMDVVSRHVAPVLTDMQENMVATFDKKKTAELNRELRAAVKETK